MKQKFEQLVNLKTDKCADGRFVKGFNARQEKREVEYQAKAKRNAPTEQFYARSYNL